MPMSRTAPAATTGVFEREDIRSARDCENSTSALSWSPDNIVGMSCRNADTSSTLTVRDLMLTIQQAQPSDWPNIQSGLACTHLNEGVVTSEIDATNLVACIDGRFAGFCMVVQCADVAILPALFVDSRFRGRGIAEHLIERCVAQATSHGARWVFTACPASGVPFMERIGFEVERRELVPMHVLHRLEAAGGGCLSLLSMHIKRGRILLGRLEAGRNSPPSSEDAQFESHCK